MESAPHSAVLNKARVWILPSVFPSRTNSAQAVFVLIPLLLVLFAVALTQGVLIWFIWRDLESLSDSPFCQNNTILHVFVVAIVVVQFYLQVPDFLLDQEVMNSNYFVITKEIQVNVKNEARLRAYRTDVNAIGLGATAYLILFEETLLLVFSIVGIRYVLQQDGASNIIQACISLQFILDIDNYIYAVMIPDSLKEVLASIKFAIVPRKVWEKRTCIKTAAQSLEIVEEAKSADESNNIEKDSNPVRANPVRAVTSDPLRGLIRSFKVRLRKRLSSEAQGRLAQLPFDRSSGVLGEFIPYHMAVQHLAQGRFKEVASVDTHNAEDSIFTEVPSTQDSDLSIPPEVRDTITFASNAFLSVAFKIALALAVVFGLRTDYCDSLS